MYRPMLVACGVVTALLGFVGPASADDIPCPVQKATWEVATASTRPLVRADQNGNARQTTQRLHQRPGIDHVVRGKGLRCFSVSVSSALIRRRAMDTTALEDFTPCIYQCLKRRHRLPRQ